jgi:hypothetical protein
MEMTSEELKKIMDQHCKWLNHNGDGSRADLKGDDLRCADLRDADLRGADLEDADLRCADLRCAYLRDANLSHANLEGADLEDADLTGAKINKKFTFLNDGNTLYYKRLRINMSSNDYIYKVGINKLKKGEVFASDERVPCSYPALYFASKEWCDEYYPERELELTIRIPKEARINNPYASDGKASANMIEVVSVVDTRTGEDVTEKYRTGYGDGFGERE